VKRIKKRLKALTKFGNFSKGFTLMELLVVVSIMAILSAIVLPTYSKTMRKGKVSDCLSVIKMVTLNQEHYFIKNGVYATSFSELESPVSGLVGSTAKTQSGITITDFVYKMQDACIIAINNTDKYTLTRNFITQDEGCLGEGCNLVRDVIPNTSVSCTFTRAYQQN
jgi:prepilin-type N-terminal cleavage/methylation domain-containing protein